jgi:hypothetical protein
MKTTLEIPDLLFRKAKAKAAERGIPLQLGAGTTGDKPWMRMAGGLRHLRKETSRVNRLIEEEFERASQ